MQKFSDSELQAFRSEFMYTSYAEYKCAATVHLSLALTNGKVMCRSAYYLLLDVHALPGYRNLILDIALHLLQTQS